MDAIELRGGLSVVKVLLLPLAEPTAVELNSLTLTDKTLNKITASHCGTVERKDADAQGPPDAPV